MHSSSYPATGIGERQRGGQFPRDQTTCPLCASGMHKLIETIPCDDLRYVYRRMLGITIAAEPRSTLAYLRCTNCDLRFFVPLMCGDSAFYQKLQAFSWYYLEEKSEYHMAVRLIPAGSSVLEVGCGSGAFSTFLPPGCRYRGLEYNDEAIRKARQRGLDVDRSSIEELSRSSESMFDVACAFQVLEHVASPASFLAAAVRLLKPRGLLIIAVPSEDSFMADEVNNVLNMPPHHLTRWTDTALESIARVAGLRLIHLEHEPVSDIHLRPLANAHVWRAMRRNLGWRVPMVSTIATTFWATKLLRLLSMPIEKQTLKRKLRPIGHSVVAAYSKD
jgi:SAM-dependent methyltransferase